MGVIYKLKPGLKEYIVNAKQLDPDLSCRKLASLVLSKFQLKLSKSSINAVMKEADLSMPVGRRRKAKRGIVEAPGLGTILLKAADYMLGGSLRISEIIKKSIDPKDKDLLAKTEYLIYSPLFDLSSMAHMETDSALWALINQRFSHQAIESYLNELQHLTDLSTGIHKIISELFQEVRCLKLNLTNGEAIFLDGQFNSLWSTQNIPYNFSTTVCNIKSYIKGQFITDKPLILFTAPGNQTPSKELFNLILALESKDNLFSSLTLIGNRHDDIETVGLKDLKKKSLIFGLWPWQFTAFRKAKIAENFKKFYFEPLKRDFYIAEAEIQLSQPALNKSVTLKGCALKKSLIENVKLVILSTSSASEIKIEDIASLYLDRKPNLEEALDDFNRKCELFTYSASIRPHFSMQKLDWSVEASQDISSLFNYYLHMLDLYVKWQFLPVGYDKKPFSTINEQFYSLKARLKRQKDRLFVTFKPAQDYRFLKDLEYACRRINEKEIMIEGRKLWCNASD